MLLPLPRRLRPFLLDLALMVWTVLELTYLASRIPAGGFRVLVPRFNWRFIVEDLAVAPEVLEHAVSTALLGEQPRSLYEFRAEGEEYVREWSPRIQQSSEAYLKAVRQAATGSGR